MNHLNQRNELKTQNEYNNQIKSNESTKIKIPIELSMNIYELRKSKGDREIFTHNNYSNGNESNIQGN